MTTKITRKLFNHYNNIFEVTFDDGSVVDGKYKVQLKNEEHNSSLTTVNFVISSFPDINKCSDLEKTNSASYAIEMEIKDRVEKFVMKNF